MKWILFFCLLCQGMLMAISQEKFEDLKQMMQYPPFAHPVKYLTSSEKEASVMLCFHGFGGDLHIIDSLAPVALAKNHLVSFNLPDADISAKNGDLSRTTWGTYFELLPACYLLHKLIIEGNLDSIDLYGFSAGGGAIINILTILNSDKHENIFRGIGILAQDRKRMLEVIQKGLIILDCPLKSWDEVVEMRKDFSELKILAKRHRDEQLRPIDSLNHLKGLSLHVLLHFQNPDEILSNRDDELFIQRMQAVNALGQTWVVIGHEGGHNAFHRSLWKARDKIGK